MIASLTLAVAALAAAPVDTTVIEAGNAAGVTTLSGIDDRVGSLDPRVAVRLVRIDGRFEYDRERDGRLF